MNLIDFLFPPKCSICGRDVSDGAVCRECAVKLLSKINLRKFSFEIEAVAVEGCSVLEYDDKDVQKLLFSLKQSGDKGLFRFAAGLYRQAIPQNFHGIVTNVPRRNSSVRVFGYDHVKEPLKIMCRGNDKASFEEILSRRGLSQEQKNLTARQRLQNAQGKFCAIKKDIQTNILLVDDVVTTGSTIISCATEILNANPDAKLYFACLASRNTFSGIR